MIVGNLYGNRIGIIMKIGKFFLWIALCSRTKQIVAFFLGDSSAKSCQALWDLST